MKHILITIVGWVVILILLLILFIYTIALDRDSGLGFAYGVMALFFSSITCTAGISLIIWIPVGYSVGLAVFTIFGWRDQKIEAKPAEDRQQPELSISKVQSLTERLNQELRNDPALNRNQFALLNYIKKARTKGLNDEQISKNLTNNGWTFDSIAAAFQMVGNGQIRIRSADCNPHS